MINRFVGAYAPLDDAKIGCDNDSVDDQESKNEHHQSDDNSQYNAERPDEFFSPFHSVL